MLQIDDNFLIETLRKACSLDPNLVKDAEAKIQALEITSGFCFKLLTIINNYSFEVNFRFMASSCLKNAIDKYWRKSAPNSIKEEERQAIKANFLQFLTEPELKIARQMSVILGKLARFELPHQWPDLIAKLVQVLQETASLQQISSANQENISNTPALNTLIPLSTDHTNQKLHLVSSRCLMALHAIIKSLASKRLSNDRKVFEELSHNLITMINQFAFYYIQKCIVDKIGETSQMSGNTYTSYELQNHSFCLDQAILCVKILHKLVLHGFKDNIENETLSHLILNLLQSFNQLITKYNRIINSTDSTIVDFFKEKYAYLIVLYVQVLTDYQDTYPFNFIQTGMSDCLSLIIQVCFTPQGQQLSFPKLNIILMNFMKSIIMCDKYKQRLIKIDDKLIQEKQQKAVEIKQNFFTTENLQQILSFLFNEFLLMTEEELELWCESPEEFINEDGTATDAWKYNNRACAETLFQAFVHEYNNVVVPIVVELIQLNSRIKFDGTPNENFTSPSFCLASYDPFELKKSNIDRHILLKDASYNCASIAAWELVSHIDFDVWFTQSLLPELKSFYGRACHVLIRRRILIVISNWVNIKMSIQNRVVVYELLCECLQTSQDLVIRLQATLTLKAVMDDVHFEKESYLPYLNYHFGLLCQLLKEVEDGDTKIKVLSVLSFLIERVDIHIRPYCTQLADYLPFLWEHSAEHNMLRCSIVIAFHHLVKSFGSQSTAYHTFLIPVIHYSTDSNNPASVYLLEDGLELWNITVQNSLQMTTDLLTLFSNIKPLLERDTDTWKLCLEIVDSYVILDARQFFQFYGEFLVNKFCGLLNESIKIDALLRLMRSVGHIFEVPADGVQIHLFEPFILKAISLALNSDVYPMITAMCLSTLAKPVLDDCLQFMKVVEKCALMRNQTPESLFGDLLDSWIDKIDMIVHPERRKLTALALVSLLRFNSNVIFERFGAILNVCVTVMLDVLKEDNGVKFDCLVMSPDVENDDEEIDTEHEKRKRRIRLSNPVYSVSIKEFVILKLRECENLVGLENFQQLMKNLEPSIGHKLNELMN